MGLPRSGPLRRSIRITWECNQGLKFIAKQGDDPILRFAFGLAHRGSAAHAGIRDRCIALNLAHRSRIPGQDRISGNQSDSLA